MQIIALAYKADDQFSTAQLEKAAWLYARQKPVLKTADGSGTVEVVESYIWRTDPLAIDYVDGSTTVVSEGDWVVGLKFDETAAMLYEEGKLLRKEWTEDLHPRDDHGRFSDSDAPTESTSNDYEGSHNAPSNDGFSQNILNIEQMMPDVTDPKMGAQLYGYGTDERSKQADRESLTAIQQAVANPDRPVTIYRAVPKGADKINNGDWVTLSPTYAQWHAESNIQGESHIISEVVKPTEIWNDGNSIHEFGLDRNTGVAKEWNEDLHPRDENGRFTSGGGLDVPALASDANEGFSIDPFTGKSPTTGYMVARSQYGEIHTTNSVEETADAIQRYADKHAHLFAEDKSLYLGGWRNSEDGKLYLDISDNVKDEGKAVALGRNRDQISVFNLDTFEEINTGGTGKGNGKPEFDRNPDDIFGEGTVIRKSAGELFVFVGRGEASVGVEVSGEDSRLLKAWEEALHPRDEHGRFVDSGVLAATFESIANAKDGESVASTLRVHFGRMGDRGFLKTEGFGNRNLDLDRVKEAARTIVTMNTKYPQAQLDQVVIKTFPKDDLTTAQTQALVNRRDDTLDSIALVINSRIINKAEAEENDQLHTIGQERGWNHKVDDKISMVESSLVHEWGHMLDYSRPNGARHAIPVPTVFLNAAAEHGITDAAKAGEWAAPQISDYGKTNEREMVAEAFRDVVFNKDNAQPISKAFTAKLLESF